MPENSVTVPFGKYKGQPLEIMLSDANYVSYQKQQPGFMKWLQDNHITIYNIFTSGAPQVQDTPEHNKLQARFLDGKFLTTFFTTLYDLLDGDNTYLTLLTTKEVYGNFRMEFECG